MDTLFEVVHSVDMIHPKYINISEKYHSFKVLEHFVAEKFSLFLKALMASFLKHINCALNRKHINVIVKVVLGCKPALIFFLKTCYVPIALMVACKVVFNIFLNVCIKHLKNFICKVNSVKNLISLLINELSLTVHNIVILKRLLSYAEVSAFNLFLR